MVENKSETDEKVRNYVKTWEEARQALMNGKCLDVSDEINIKEGRIPPKTAAILEFHGDVEFERGEFIDGERVSKLMEKLRDKKIVKF